MTMDNFKELPLEVRLSAFMDGQVEDEDARELEALIASDAEAKLIYEQLKAGSDFGTQCFEELLKEPVPLDLVRSIKAIEAQQAQPPPARQAANGNVVSFMRFVPQAIAASIVLLFAGGYAGYYVAENRIPTGNMPDLVSETSNIEAASDSAKTRSIGNLTFDAPATATDAESNLQRAAAPAVSKSDVTLAEVADAHKVYVADTVRADELPATRQNELISYLEAVTGVKFAVPDLSAEGFRLRGGRLVEIVGQPGGALFYEDGSGKAVAVYFMKNENIAGSLARDGFTILGGQKAATSFFVAAADAGLARKLETSVSAAF